MHNQPLPPLDALTAITEASRLRSFSLAAETLSVTHSTISRRVQSVETWLGFRVFERRARGVRPTEAGQRFISTLDDALAAISNFSQQWRPAKQSSLVRISVASSIAQLWLIPRLVELQGPNKSIRIQLLTEPRTYTLEAGEADIAIRCGLAALPGLTRKHLTTERLVPVASKSVAANLPRDITPQELAKFVLLHDTDTRMWKEWFAQTAIKLDRRSNDQVFHNYELVLAAIEASVGIGMLRMPLATAWMSRSDVVFLTDRIIENPLSQSIYMRKGEDRDHVLDTAERIIKSFA